ncbi:MAG: hypothetical protein K6E73_08020 [Bacteroidales bacterium]|nr:hypothetical protein [Bacteroidales bacterium]
MKKILNVVMLLGGLLCAPSCKTTMIAPESMAYVNLGRGGSLTADKVIRNSKETVIHFTMNYQPKEKFRYGSDGYLLDELGRRYALISADGIDLDKWRFASDSGIVRFVMHFEPLAKDVKVFDFIEGEDALPFKLLGIHSRKTKLEAPTLQEISSADKFRLSDDWLRRDTVTLRGRIEGYDAETFGYRSMRCYPSSVFELQSGALTFDIAADGTFERRFVIDYPMMLEFWPTDRTSDKYYFPIQILARPGETTDVTLRRNENVRYECIYNRGSSLLVERLLKSGISLANVSSPLKKYDGSMADVAPLADRTWNNLLWRVQMVAAREKFTPMEMQLALADAQVNYACAFMDNVYGKTMGSLKMGRRDGSYFDEVANNDSAIYDAEAYTSVLQRVDFDNPLQLFCQNYHGLMRHMQYAFPVRRHRSDSIATGIGSTGKVFKRTPVGQEMQSYRNFYKILRQMMGSEQDNMMAQICVYRDMLFKAKNMWRDGEAKRSDIMADTTLTEQERTDKLADEVSISSIRPHLMPTFKHPYVHEMAESAFDEALAKSQLTSPLPGGNKAADFITDFNVKFLGQFLLFDFWGLGCAPCRAAIEQGQAMRAQIAAREDITLIFVAPSGENGGSQAYRDYVEKWMLDGEEVVFVTEEQFDKLQELFRFDGIPHYELITPAYRRVNPELVPEYTNIFFMDKFEQVKEMLKE